MSDELTNVLVLLAPDEPHLPGLEALEGQAVVQQSADPQFLIHAAVAAEVLVVTDFRTALLDRLLPAASGLRWVHATSAGVDAVLGSRELRRNELPLTNARGIFDRPIAEHVLAMMLAFCKDLPETVRLQAKRTWRHRETERLEGKRLLVVGAGGIGRAVARLAAAAGLEVTGCGNNPREDDPDFGYLHGVEQFHELLSRADFTVAATPLTAETRGLFDQAAFAAMRRGSRFINVGRGALVRTEALVEALQSGHLGGAALDVFEQEPLPYDHPLWAMPQVIVTPHMAGDVIGWRAALGRQFADNFLRWQRGEPLQNRVDKARGYSRVSA